MAETLFEAERWPDALDYFSRYQAQKPGESDVLLKLGICSFQTNRPDEARRFFSYIIDDKGDQADPLAFYWLARTLHAQSEFRPALTNFKLFLKTANDRHPLRAHAVDNIKRCVSGLKLAPTVADALVENLGDAVNTAGDEFGPVPSPNHADRIYFSAAREGNIGGLRDEKGLESPEKGRFTSDMFVTGLESGSWAYPAAMGSLINTARFEQVLDFTEHGQVMHYLRGFSLFAGEMLTDTAAKKDEFRVDGNPFLSQMLPEKGDCAPFFFNDTTLLFASRRTGGQGGLDLWMSTFSVEKKEWRDPQNLGPTINSGYDETTPFLAKDGRTLFFSSNRTESMGGFDIFTSRFDDRRTAWPAPSNPGQPLNSPADDAFFRLTADGKDGFFSSNRLDGFGQRDLFVAHFKKERTEQRMVSNPLIFSQLEPKTSGTEPEILLEFAGRDTTTQPIFYENDRDLTSPPNLKRLDGFIALAQALPKANVLVTCHTDDAESGKFSLYYGIKRAEIVSKIMQEKGISAERIILRSAGLQYPLAKNVVNAEPSIAGQRLNRRIEFQLGPAASLPAKIGIDRPLVSPIMAADGADFLDEMERGLSYRVLVATTKQILGSDELMMFNDLFVEMRPGTGGQYSWFAGLFKTSNSANDLRRELVGQGFEEARVVAFIDGVRLPKSEAKTLVKTFPDLSFWLEKN